ncbi:hypothetical protein GGR52DRAFT_558722 [Hypoxylon sp. FL1284]|nr:hypothetical protein GGR52DRAFT_558722 [Hypoxylon sp. FL1284]
MSLSDPPPKAPQKWTLEEDSQLSAAVAQEVQAGRTINWQTIARRFPGRTNKDCRKRWYYHISQPLQRGPWSKEEDARLRQGVRQYGTRWSKVADLVQTRNGDQCYKRWTDSLDPQIDKSPWTAEEDALLLEGVQTVGRNWKEIVSSKLPYRTGLAAKNRYSFLQRQMENGQSTVRGSKRGTRKRSSQSSSNSSVVDVEEHEHAEANVQQNEQQPNTYHVGTMLADMDKGLEMTGVDILDPNLNFKLNAAGGQVDLFNNNIATTTGFMPTIPHTSPVAMSDFQDWRSPEDFSPHHSYNNHFMDWGQANNISIPGSSDSSRQSSVGTGTRDVLVRATCHPEQTKSVLEELTRAVNVMTLRGDIRSFNFAVE